MDHNATIPGARYSTFREVFYPNDGDPIEIAVPSYQRAYDWRENHRRDMLDDLERLANLADAGSISERAGHFCGTLICTPVAQRPGHYEIVDGQQRMTTLVLLHALLTRSCGSETFLVDSQRSRLLFEPQNNDRGFFSDLILWGRTGDADSQGKRNYVAAHKQLDAWVNTLPSDRRALMRQLVEERLQFIFFVLPDEDEVSKVFETINNRGKALTQMDLVKNHLIYVKALHGWGGVDVNSVWSSIEAATSRTQFRGNEDVDTVLRAVVNAMFRPGRREAGESDFRVISERIVGPDDVHTFGLFLSFLKSAFGTFQTLRSAHRTGRGTDVANQLTYLNHHPVIAGILPLILVREFSRQHDNGEAGVLEAIEKANFRLYGLENGAARSNSHDVPLRRLAHEYFQFAHGMSSEDDDEEDDILAGESESIKFRSRDDDEIARVLIAKLTAIVNERVGNGFRQIVEALTLDDDERFDFHGWDCLRYFLARYEESLLSNGSFNWSRLGREYRESYSNDYLAREHIYPRGSEESLTRYRNGQQMRRLGNFVLLPQGVNSEFSNKPVNEKIALMEGARQRVDLLRQNERIQDVHGKAALFRQILEERQDGRFGEERHWFRTSTKEANGLIAEAKTFCDLREQEMIAFALRTWRMPDEHIDAAEAECFVGMFSFRHEGECYESDGESPIDKTNENFVMQRDLEGATRPRPLDRLNARAAVLDVDPLTVTWPINE